MKNTKKLFAFTLAEVLITLAIIGVVAAMTIPILMQNYQKGQYVTALKKVYSQLSDAIDRVMLDSNADNFNDVSLLNGASPDPKAFFKKYFRVSKYCDTPPFTSCFDPNVSSIDKSSSGNPVQSHDYCVILKDGASLCIENTTTGDPDYFVVDTNGLDKPNIAGRDIFTLSVYHDGSIDEVNPEALADNGVTAKDGRKEQCESNAYGWGCFSKIIDAGWKMDY